MTYKNARLALNGRTIDVTVYMYQEKSGRRPANKRSVYRIHITVTNYIDHIDFMGWTDKIRDGDNITIANEHTIFEIRDIIVSEITQNQLKCYIDKLITYNISDL